MATYQGQSIPWRGVKISPNWIRSRAVDLAIPAKVANQAQLKTLQQLQSYAAGRVRPVTLRIIPIP